MNSAQRLPSNHISSFNQFTLSISYVAIFILGMNYASPSAGGEGLSISFNQGAYAGLLVMLIALGVSWFKYNALRNHSTMLLLISPIFLLIVPLAYVDTEFLYQARYSYYGLLLGLIFFFALFQFDASLHKQQILSILLASSLLQSLWGLVQYYFIFEPHWLFPQAVAGKPYGTFSQVNVFATYLSLGSLIAVYFLFNKKHLTVLSVLGVCLVLIINGHLSMLAETKSGRVISLIAMAIYLAYWAWRSRRLVIPLLLFCSLLVASFMPKYWFDVRSEQGEAGPGAAMITSVGVRPQMYDIAMAMLVKQPLQGYGVGKVQVSYAEAQGDYIRQYPDAQEIHQVKHIHNEILQWGLQLGIVGMLSFFVLAGLIVYLLGKRRLDPRILLLGLPMVGHAMLEMPFDASVPHFFALLTVIALATNGASRDIKMSESMSKVAVFILFCIGLALANTLYTANQAHKALASFIVGGNKDVTLLTSVRPSQNLQDAFEEGIQRWTLVNAVNRGYIYQHELDTYIAWASEFVRINPYRRVYKQLADAHLINNDRLAALKVLKQAAEFYPKTAELTQYYNALKLDKVNFQGLKVIKQNASQPVKSENQ